MDSNDKDLNQSGEYVIAIVVDACGLRCPLPLLKAKQALNKVPVGSVVQVLATDAGASRDIPSFAKLSSHTLLSITPRESGVLEFLLRKCGPEKV